MLRMHDELLERNYKIASLRHDGATYRSIGRQFGLSGQRVSDIVKYVARRERRQLREKEEQANDKP